MHYDKRRYKSRNWIAGLIRRIGTLLFTLAKVPDQFTEHISLAQTCWLNGVDVIKTPIWFGQLNEARKLSVADTLAALEVDSRNTQDDLTLLKAARKDL